MYIGTVFIETRCILKYITFTGSHYYARHLIKYLPIPPPMRLCLSRRLSVCLSVGTTDRILMKILPAMNLWSRKFPFHFGLIRIWTPDVIRTPDSDRIRRVGGLRCASAVVVAVIIRNDVQETHQEMR